MSPRAAFLIVRHCDAYISTTLHVDYMDGSEVKDHLAYCK